MANDERYCAYVLRGWREAGGDGEDVWRFRLRDVQSGEERAFRSVAAVAVYLREELSGDRDQGSGGGPEA